MPGTLSKLLRKTKDACGVFNEATCKANCKMSATRAKMAMNKESATREAIQREVAKLIQENKLEKARVKAEQYMQSEKTEVALDVLETHLELLHTRTGYVASSRHMPEDLRVCVATIMHCEGKIPIDELKIVCDQLRMKWGSSFQTKILDPEGHDAHPKIVDALSIYPPSAVTIESCLSTIAQKHGIEYLPALPEPNELTIEELQAGAPPEPSTAPAGSIPEPFLEADFHTNQNGGSGYPGRGGCP